jgi:hypothetical protein
MWQLENIAIWSENWQKQPVLRSRIILLQLPIHLRDRENDPAPTHSSWI